VGPSPAELARRAEEARLLAAHQAMLRTGKYPPGYFFRANDILGTIVALPQSRGDGSSLAGGTGANDRLTALGRGLDQTIVPMPEIPYDFKGEDDESILILDRSMKGIAFAKLAVKLSTSPTARRVLQQVESKVESTVGGAKIPVAIVLITGETIISAANAANLFVIRENKVYERGLIFLKDPQTRSQFAMLVSELRNHNHPGIERNAPTDMLEAARAIVDWGDKSGRNGSQIIWDDVMTPEVRKVWINTAISVTTKFVAGKLVDPLFPDNDGLSSVSERPGTVDGPLGQMYLARHHFLEVLGNSPRPEQAAEVKDGLALVDKAIADQSWKQIKAMQLGVELTKKALEKGVEKGVEKAIEKVESEPAKDPNAPP
jgi:hypothetical protein